MSSHAETSPETPPAQPLNQRRLRGALILVMGLLAIAAPFFAGQMTFLLGGVLLIICGALEMLETLHSSGPNSRSAYMSGELSIVSGILLLCMPELIFRVAALLLGGVFLLDGAGKVLASLRAKLAGTSWMRLLGTGLVILMLGLMLVARWPVGDWSLVALVVGVRMLTVGWSMVIDPRIPPSIVEGPADQHPDLGLNLPAHAAFEKLNATVASEEEGRRAIDAYWCWVFVIVFFAIHIGRMRVYWTMVGLISPLVAVVGDLAVTLLVAFAVVLPVRLAWRRLTRPVERRLWERSLASMDQSGSPSLLSKVYQGWLVSRLRFARQIRAMRHAPRPALRWGMQVGLPITAVFIAIQPIFGFSWFFNSENWATIVWQRWAETRTDGWRENMIGALREHYQGVPEDQLFRLEPELGDDFSFLVLGDTGEGGPGQHSLRDQYLFLGQRPDVKFLVISSDVIYPDGAMRDYEHNFYLPFKGFTKPIYAIPGNHDWYDALEGFAANFLHADAARVCMRSRVDTDGRLTTTTEGRIDGYIDQAAQLRHRYGVRVGFQRGPFFEVQTDRFALIAVDTGVLKTVDSAQGNWLKGALARARGKFIMVMLGHPLYTAGHYQGDGDQITGEWKPPPPSLLEPGESKPFTALHRLLRAHQVDVVMAGDMHDFEYYEDPYQANGQKRSMRHFVNGGGGAYIVFGMPFDWPANPDLPVWSHYPRKDAITEKLDAQTPTWKMPLWLWVKHFSAWPFSGYIMSAAFNQDHAPFFQSFVEVQVRNSKEEVAFVVHGANGRLRWRELENYRAILPEGKTEDDLVEFIVKMPPR